MKSLSVFDWYERSYKSKAIPHRVETNYNIPSQLSRSPRLPVHFEWRRQIHVSITWFHVMPSQELLKALKQMRRNVSFSSHCDKDLHKCLIYFNIQTNCDVKFEFVFLMKSEKKIVFVVVSLEEIRKRSWQLEDGIRIFNKVISEMKIWDTEIINLVVKTETIEIPDSPGAVVSCVKLLLKQLSLCE